MANEHERRTEEGIYDRDSITKRYEALRSCAIGDEVNFAIHSLGYALLLRQGMAVWLKGWKDATVTMPTKGRPADVLVDTTTVASELSAITCILVNMLLETTGKATVR